MVNESFTSKRQEYFTVKKKNLVNKRPHLKQDDIWPCFITKATSLNHFYADQSYFSYQLIYSN